MVKTITHTLIPLLLLLNFETEAQCDFKSKIASDGNLYYYIPPENFYKTAKKNLSGGIITDKEYYYLVLFPTPLPDKAIARKLKDNITVKLANDSIYLLDFYYSDYNKADTLLEMMFLINKKNTDVFVKFEMKQIMINMGEGEGIRTYNLKLHKNAVQVQLNCFFEDKKKEGKKN